jgi:virginiamycin B lyase
MRLTLPAPLFLLALAVGCAAPPAEAPAPAPLTGLAGTVLDAGGQPVAGAFVTARDSASARQLSVRTGRDGTYHLPVDLSGPLVVRVHAIGVAEGAGVRVASLPARLDLAVDRVADTFGQLPSSAYLGALPDGEAKRRFVLDCGGCHQFNRVRADAGPLVRSRTYWQGWTAQMVSFAGAHTGFPIMAPGRDPDATADWLVQHLGGEGDPLPVLTPPPFDVPAERVLITEYDVPTRRDLPHDLMPDADGHIVVTGMMSGQMFRLDPATGTWASERGERGFPGARALDIAPDGAWWVLLGTPRQITRFDPASGEQALFDIGVYPHSIVRDATGRIWFNAHFSKAPETLGVLDPATGHVRTFEVPTPPQADGGSTIPYGLRIDADGVLWGTQLLGNRLVRFDPESERFRLYDLPTTQSGPRRPAIGPDGTIWIPEFAAGKLAAFDPATETFTEHPLPVPDALPYVVRVDPRSGVVWVATGAADAVLRFFPAEGRWTVHPLPTRGALVRHMELDADGGAWVAYGNSPAVDPKVARIEVLD